MTDPDANIWSSARQRLRDYVDGGMKSNEQKAQEMQKKYANGHWTDALPATDPDKYLLDPRVNTDDTKLKALRTVGDQVFDVFGDPFIATSLVKHAVKPLVKPFLKKTVEAPGKLAETLAGELGTAGRKGVVMTKTKEGRQQLADAWDQELPVAREMTEKVFNAGKHLPERAEVAAVIKNMPDIEMDSFVAKIRSLKKEDEVTDIITSYNKKLDKWANRIEKQYGGKKVSAKRYRDMRIDLDQTVNFTADEKALMDDAFLGVRRKMADNLVKNAPEEYKSLMKGYAEKLQTVDRMKSKLGNNKATAHEKAFSLLRRSEGKSMQPTKEIMEEFDQTFKTDFSKKSETMDISRKLGDPNEDTFKIPITPKGVGSTKFYAMATGGLGSPRIAPNILKTIDLVEGAIKKTGKIAGVAVDDAAKLSVIASTIKNLTPKKRKKLDKALENEDEQTINLMLKQKGIKMPKVENNVKTSDMPTVKRGTKGL